jgi:hypothetical protein
MVDPIKGQGTSYYDKNENNSNEPGTDDIFDQVNDLNGTGLGNCADTYCHGTDSFTWRTPQLTGSDNCTICHGLEQSGTADMAAPAQFRAPGVSGGVDTAGDVGADSDGVNTDPQIGAHSAHMLLPLGLTDELNSAGNCNECHKVPPTVDDADHWDTNGLPVEVFTTNVADIEKADLGTSGITPSYAGGSGTCIVYCHGADMPKGSPQNAVQDWNTSLIPGSTPALAGYCDRCHEAPPTGVSPHTGSEVLADCAGCHPHFNTDGTLTAGANRAQHIDGTVQAAVDCVSCHGTSGPGIDVQTEFGTAITDVNSHHIQKAWASFTGEDCVACHGEGDPNGDGTASQSGLHPAGAADGTVQMVDNSDSSRTTFLPINLTNLEGKDNSGGDVDNLVDFCFGCHRSGGANAIIPGNGFDVNHTTANPFAETTNLRTNQYDEVTKSFSIDGGGLAVYEAFDPGTGPGVNSPDSHHAVRGPRYTGTILRTNGFLSATVTLWDGTTGVDDNSTMFCTDCHSVAFSAHGGNNEYMLQTNTVENPAGEHTDPGVDLANSYVCFKCHIGPYSSDATHTGNGNNYVHSANLDGTARLNNEGHMSGIACLNCHDGNVGFGGIHGFSDATFTAGEGGSGGGTYNKRRFLPGSANAYYDPSDANAGGDADWQIAPGSADNVCYTIAAPSSITACTHHSMGANLNDRSVQRNVDY